MACLHENAVYNLEFNRYLDDKGEPRKFTADLTIFCRECGARFSFSEPVISGDGFTLTATIASEERISDSLDLRDLFLNGRNDE